MPSRCSAPNGASDVSSRSTAPTTTDYDRYEESLRELAGLPEALKAALQAAARQQADQSSAVERGLKGELDRLAKLRGTTEQRYRRAAAELKEQGVPLPAQVRPADGERGDPDALAAVLKTHATAIAAVERAIEAAKAAEARAARTEQDRQEAARLAAESLRRRQELTRRARAAAAEAEAAEAERARVEEEERKARRRRLLLVLYAAAGALALAVGIVLIVNLT